MADIATPAELGTYALILRSRGEVRICAGKLGELELQSGFYIYIGSAFGPGGLRARIGHHGRIARRPHWHIDYLRAGADLLEVWYSRDNQRREHLWAKTLGAFPGMAAPWPGFGASDCRCLTHLFFSKSPPSFDDFSSRLLLKNQRHSAIHRQPYMG